MACPKFSVKKSFGMHNEVEIAALFMKKQTVKLPDISVAIILACLHDT